LFCTSSSPPWPMTGLHTRSSLPASFPFIDLVVSALVAPSQSSVSLRPDSTPFPVTVLHRCCKARLPFWVVLRVAVDVSPCFLQFIQLTVLPPAPVQNRRLLSAAHVRLQPNVAPGHGLVDKCSSIIFL
jgi:hypothetical protein